MKCESHYNILSLFIYLAKIHYWISQLIYDRVVGIWQLCN